MSIRRARSFFPPTALLRASIDRLLIADFNLRPSDRVRTVYDMEKQFRKVYPRSLIKSK